MAGSTAHVPVKRALVTGLTGFTGLYVAQQLREAGFEVHGITERPSIDAKLHKADLADVDGLGRIIDLIQPSVVVHLAAIAFVGNANAQAFYTVNTIGTRNLLEALERHAKSIECVLLASSANIYGNGTEGMLDEATPPNPANDYAVSKLAMEHMARLWFDRLPIVIARPFNYTGVGQSESFLLPKIVAHFRRHAKLIELGNCDVFRDFSDVRAVASAYRRLIEVGPIGKTFNVSSGVSHSLRDVVAMMEEIAGYRIEIQINPAFVRTNEVRSLLGSAEALRHTIGDWGSPPLRETLEWMYHAQQT